MPDYIIPDEENQVVSTEKLQDEKFPWRERKKQTLRLADIYSKAGYADYAGRASYCSTWLEYYALHDDFGELQKDLKHANFCNLRLCPLCSTRRALKAAIRLTSVLNRVEQGHKGVLFIFLTLTIQNVSYGELSAALTSLTSAFHKLMRHRPIQRAVKGWFRAIEITHGKNGFHPHLHVIIAVEPDYFQRSSGLYITQAEWEKHWKKALKVDYKPRVDIRATRSKTGFKSNLSAALEAAKYTVKSDEYIGSNVPMDEAVKLVKEYTDSLYRRRLTAFGGWLKEAAQQLAIEDLEDGDLVHIDDKRIREDIAEMILCYGWNFGMGDYILRDIAMNNVQNGDEQ